VGIAARDTICTICSAFYIRILTSARWARYRTRRYAAFQAKPWGASSPKANDGNIHLWRKSRFAFPLLIVSGIVIFHKNLDRIGLVSATVFKLVRYLILL
jgi:hypothetical protein